jgi:hypothetical protein
MKVIVGSRAALVVLLLAVLTLSSCTRDASWNQRLTLVIETPQGEVRGSSVTSVSVVDYSGPLVPAEARGPQATVKGEAVAVEVVPHMWLFALLGGGENAAGNATAWAEVTYAPSRDAANRSRGYWERVADIKGQPSDTPVPMPREAWPMLVTFDDITKPETVRRVNPDDLAAVFGEGVRLKAVTLEITEDAVTEGRVDALLTWLGPYQEPGLCPVTGGLLADAPFCRRVTMGAFVQRPER